MRLFIGIDFDLKTKDKICEIQRELRKSAIKGRWKYADNFHLTLKFLGEVSDNRISELDNALKNATLDKEQFNIKIDKIGCFNDSDSIRVMWLGLCGEIEKLNLLYRDVENEFEKIGFPKEKRSYSPHVTIAQDVVLEKPFDEIKIIIDKYDFEVMKIEKIVLMDSRQIKGKRVYTVIGEWRL